MTTKTSKTKDAFSVRFNTFVSLRIDNFRKKVRMFCFDKNLYQLFLWLSTKDELETLNAGLKLIEMRRNFSAN